MPAARSAQLHLQRFVYVRLKVLRRFHRRVYFFDDGGCTAGCAAYNEEIRRGKNVDFRSSCSERNCNSIGRKFDPNTVRRAAFYVTRMYNPLGIYRKAQRFCA